MDPRIRIHIKMSWIRNTAFSFLLPLFCQLARALVRQQRTECGSSFLFGLCFCFLKNDTLLKNLFSIYQILTVLYFFICIFYQCFMQICQILLQYIQCYDKNAVKYICITPPAVLMHKLKPRLPLPPSPLASMPHRTCFRVYLFIQSPNF
jgi:hypothetical protein